MSWFESILIAVILAVVGTLFGGLVASLAVRWLKISSREGLAGYWMVFMALLAGFGSLLCGLFIARYGGFEGFFSALATAAAVVFGAIGLVGLVTWLTRDHPPRMNGKNLAFDLEVRTPPNATSIDSESGAFYGYISARGAGTIMVTLDFAGLRQEDGRWVLPGQVPFHTRRPYPYIGFGGTRLNGATVFFNLNVSGQLRQLLGQWSPWMQGSPSGNLAATSDAAGFELRVRLRHE